MYLLFRPFLALATTCILLCAFYFICSDVVDSFRSTPKPHSTTSRNQGAINYNLDPGAFTDTIATCMLDSGCRIMYQHVPKTGGNTIEATFFSIFPSKRSSCCGSKLLGELGANQDSHTAYCSAKFSAYQIRGKDMEQLVQSCMLVNKNISKNGEGKKARAVILASFREPIQHCLSTVHQMCNKNLAVRSKKTLAACQTCKYEVGTDVWDSVINRTIDWGFATSKVDRTELLTIDMIDIDSFFDRLRETMKPHGVNVPKNGRLNPEKKSQCDFRMPSVMMKKLAPAQAVYRNLTLGI